MPLISHALKQHVLIDSKPTSFSETLCCVANIHIVMANSIEHFLGARFSDKYLICFILIAME